MCMWMWRRHWKFWNNVWHIGRRWVRGNGGGYGRFETLRQTERIRIRKSAVIIENVEGKDSGTYVCYVNSTSGSDRHQIDVVSVVVDNWVSVYTFQAQICLLNGFKCVRHVFPVVCAMIKEDLYSCVNIKKLYSIFLNKFKKRQVLF